MAELCVSDTRRFNKFQICNFFGKRFSDAVLPGRVGVPVYAAPPAGHPAPGLVAAGLDAVGVSVALVAV